MTPVSEEQNGYTIKYLHDSNNCDMCKATKTFYQKLRSGRFHHTRASGEMQLFGLVTYLERVSKIKKAKSERKSFQTSPSKTQAVKTQESSLSCSLEQCSTSDVELESLDESDIEETQDTIVNLSENPKVSKEKITVNQKETLVPKKAQLGTLKRKRTALKNLLSDKNYEDDIFEREKPCDLVLLSDNESDSVDLQNMKTPPLFCLTPRESSSSPSYEDCYSPKELQLSRKEAEEYQYRRRKRRKNLKNESEDEETKPCDTKLLLEKARKVLEEQIKENEKEREQDEDEKEDYYFSDVED